MNNSQHDREPVEPPSIEAWTLTHLGYGDVLGKPIPESSPGGETGVLAENFLDAYPEDSPHRQDTVDLLEGYRYMDPTNPDYDGTQRLILRYLEVTFGPPSSEA